MSHIVVCKRQDVVVMASNSLLYHMQMVVCRIHSEVVNVKVSC